MRINTRISCEMGRFRNFVFIREMQQTAKLPNQVLASQIAYLKPNLHWKIEK